MAESTGEGPCVFCGKTIDAFEIDPCKVTVTTRAGEWQVWWCHAACFKDRIAKDTLIDLSPEFF